MRTEPIILDYVLSISFLALDEESLSGRTKSPPTPKIVEPNSHDFYEPKASDHCPSDLQESTHLSRIFISYHADVFFYPHSKGKMVIHGLQKPWVNASTSKGGYTK